MWVKMIVGFDPKDGQKIAKWREAFMHHGAHEGELTVEEIDIEQLGRRTLSARLRVHDVDIVPPLADVVVRYAKGNALTLSGISQDEPWNKWHAQAWRMEIVGLKQPPSIESQP